VNQSPAPLNKTISFADVRQGEVDRAAGALQADGALAVFPAGTLRGERRAEMALAHPVHKLWEYSRGLAYGEFEPGSESSILAAAQRSRFFIWPGWAARWSSLDIEPQAHLPIPIEWRNKRDGSSRLNLRSHGQRAAGWVGKFDRAVSFCVIEHVPKPLQKMALARLGALLKAGRYF